MLKWLGVGTVFAVLLYVAFLFAAHGGDRDFLSIDSCLDAGGRWNYTTRTCER